MATASAFASVPQDGYDLFLTAALDGCVKLWDLRCSKAVARFTAHTNRVHTIGMALSPCLRYVATGSEDKCAYLYDVRLASKYFKLPGATDSVVDVAFNPRVGVRSS